MIGPAVVEILDSAIGDARQPRRELGAAAARRHDLRPKLRPSLRRRLRARLAGARPPHTRPRLARARTRGHAPARAAATRACSAPHLGGRDQRRRRSGSLLLPGSHVGATLPTGSGRKSDQTSRDAKEHRTTPHVVAVRPLLQMGAGHDRGCPHFQVRRQTTHGLSSSLFLESAGSTCSDAARRRALPTA